MPIILDINDDCVLLKDAVERYFKLEEYDSLYEETNQLQGGKQFIPLKSRLERLPNTFLIVNSRASGQNFAWTELKADVENEILDHDKDNEKFISAVSTGNIKKFKIIIT